MNQKLYLDDITIDFVEKGSLVRSRHLYIGVEFGFKKWKCPCPVIVVPHRCKNVSCDVYQTSN